MKFAVIRRGLVRTGVLGAGLVLGGCWSGSSRVTDAWFVPRQESRVIASLVSSFDQTAWADAGSMVPVQVQTVPHEGFDVQKPIPLTRIVVEGESSLLTDAAVRVHWPVQWSEEGTVALCLYARAAAPTPDEGESRFQVIVRDTISRRSLGRATFSVDRNGGALLMPLRDSSFSGKEGLELAFYVGGVAQGLDVAVIQLVTEADGVMPRVSNIYFPGRGAIAEASSGAVAAERLTPVQFTIRDARGGVAAGLPVRVASAETSFVVGGCVDRRLWAQGEKNDVGRWYRRGVESRFGAVSLRDGFAWRWWEDDHRAASQALTEACLREAKAAGLLVVGGPLVTPGVHPLNPPKIASWSREERTRRVGAFVDRVMSACGSEVDYWVVVDDPWAGAVEVKPLFERVKKAAPEATRLLGAGALLTASEADFVRRVEQLAQWRAEGVAIDALAVSLEEDVQLGRVLPGVASIRARLDRLAEAGWRVVVTRLAVETPNRALQTDWIGRQLAMLQAHPAVELVVLDGFWDGSGPGAGWMGVDGTVLPSGGALDRMVRGPERVQHEEVLDGKGQWAVHLPPGAYEVFVGDDGPRVIEVPAGRQALILEWKRK